MQTDDVLARQAQLGESAAYAELVRRWSAPVLALCRARVRCRHAAEDLSQETLLRGWRSIGSLQDVGRFGAWLRGIAHRVCLDWLKSRKNSQINLSALADDNGTWNVPSSAAMSEHEKSDQADEVAYLMEAVESLPDEEREILMLYYSGDSTYRALAELLEVSEATVNARLTRARQRLRQRTTLHQENIS